MVAKAEQLAPIYGQDLREFISLRMWEVMRGLLQEASQKILQCGGEMPRSRRRRKADDEG